MHYLIIGGGIAGTTAAEEIRKRDPEGQISIIESEQHRLYSRVLLPHFIEGKVPREKVFLKSEEWYVKKNIDLQLGVHVEEIDLKNKFVRTSEERELPFDKLLITTGGDLRYLEQDMRGVSYLRSLDDADHMLQLISEAQALPEGERNGVVYGGGFISLEYLNIFAKHGIKTTQVMRSGGYWSRLLSEESQNVMRRHVEGNGVRVITNEKNLELLGETELDGVKLSSGEVIAAKIIGVGIGIKTDSELFEKAEIEHDAGVIANEYLETSHENVYTAGDVAEFDDVISGRRMKMGNWMNAIMQARAVVKTMMGERTKFELVSSYATDFLGKQVTFIGDVSREHADEVSQLTANDGNALEIFNRDGRTVGAVMIGDISKRQEITNAIKSKELYAG